MFGNAYPIVKMPEGEKGGNGHDSGCFKGEGIWRASRVQNFTKGPQNAVLVKRYVKESLNELRSWNR
jgi:hypothetical protein